MSIYLIIYLIGVALALAWVALEMRHESATGRNLLLVFGGAAALVWPGILLLAIVALVYLSCLAMRAPEA